MAKQTISNTDDVIDSRDVIERIEELEDTENDLKEAVEDAKGTRKEAAERALADWRETEEGEELAILRKLAEEAEGSSDWPHGESLIRESYFTQYIEQLIDDCYQIPKEITSGEWPWRHIAIDYEAAAEEAKDDYIEVSFGDVSYWIRG